MECDGLFYSDTRMILGMSDQVRRVTGKTIMSIQETDANVPAHGDANQISACVKDKFSWDFIKSEESSNRFPQQMQRVWESACQYVVRSSKHVRAISGSHETRIREQHSASEFLSLRRALNEFKRSYVFVVNDDPRVGGALSELSSLDFHMAVFG
jgi:hypothetical protein